MMMLPSLSGFSSLVIFMAADPYLRAKNTLSERRKVKLEVHRSCILWETYETALTRITSVISSGVTSVYHLIAPIAAYTEMERLVSLKHIGVIALGTLAKNMSSLPSSLMA
jgi:hypothetical protein